MITCPVCHGPKSRRAKLCASCRRASNVAGEHLLLATPDPPHAATPRPRSPEQNRAFHGKCAAIAARTGETPIAVKAAARARASELFGRAIESSADLTELEMDRLLDELDGRLALLEAS